MKLAWISNFLKIRCAKNTFVNAAHYSFQVVVGSQSGVVHCFGGNRGQVEVGTDS